MRNYRGFSEGYYLDMHISAKNRKSQLRRLGEKLGFEVAYIGDW
jgi:hypothetical protein